MSLGQSHPQAEPGPSQVCSTPFTSVQRHASICREMTRQSSARPAQAGVRLSFLENVTSSTTTHYNQVARISTSRCGIRRAAMVFSRRLCRRALKAPAGMGAAIRPQSSSWQTFGSARRLELAALGRWSNPTASKLFLTTFQVQVSSVQPRPKAPGAL